MKKIIFILFVTFSFISCNEATNAVKSEGQQGVNAEVENPADCDDKIEDLGKKEVSEISLDAPQDGGCTLE